MAMKIYETSMETEVWRKAGTYEDQSRWRAKLDGYIQERGFYQPQASTPVQIGEGNSQGAR